MDHVIDWFVSQTSCLATKINPIVQSFTGHKFIVKTNTFVEKITKMDEGKLLRVVGAIGLGAAAIVVVRLLFRGSGKGGKTMKAPGRNFRILRNDFERNPAKYFRGLRK
ncbi:hypothetical protein E2542_SST25276 [Spatholobus suberectus]|nr:hypothetical protein E2542_SST25276 [Spatholobus suberectus]